MSRPPVRIYFDFVDPLSYVLSESLAAEESQPSEASAEWVGFELRPPPAPLTAGDDPVWAERRDAARARAVSLGLPLAVPVLVPWTRKAHELHFLAASHGMATEVRKSVFDAFFRDGLDIGRVDVLVGIAESVGLDRTEAKAVLDVDRHEADVAEARRKAVAAGVRDVPSCSVDGRVVEGFPDLADHGTLLPDE